MSGVLTHSLTEVDGVDQTDTHRGLHRDRLRTPASGEMCPECGEAQCHQATCPGKCNACPAGADGRPSPHGRTHGAASHPQQGSILCSPLFYFQVKHLQDPLRPRGSTIRQGSGGTRSQARGGSAPEQRPSGAS